MLQDQAEIAWSSSFNGFLNKIQKTTFLESIPNEFKVVLDRCTPNYRNPTTDDSYRQNVLSKKLQATMIHDLELKLQNHPVKKRLFTAQSSAPSKWLYQVLNQDSPHCLLPDQYSTQLKFRLLQDIQVNTGQCRCHSADLTDQRQIYHCLSCKDMSFNTIKRHNCVRDLLIHYVSKIEGAMANGENTVYNMQSPEHHRRYDIKVTLPSCADPIFIDALTMNICALTYQAQSNEESLVHGQRLKINKYRATIPLLVEDSRRFVPFVVDICGNIGPLGEALIDRLHEAAKAKCPRFKTLFKRDLSLIIAREVSSTITTFNVRQRAVVGAGNTG